MSAPLTPGPDASGSPGFPPLETVQAAFPQFEILEPIGRGGMGFVYKARQPHLDRLVALKLLPDRPSRDPQFAARFNREGRVLARLSHPNIVSVFDFGQAAGFYYLAMEFVDGLNLRQAMQAGRFSPAEALDIVPRICEALQYAHEQGVLHRDIKPENILLDSRGRVKIADFGIAKLVGEDPSSLTLTGTGAALGTPHYMAPEQLETPSTVDHRADIYSLGVVFYEMLTGELPIGRFAPPSAKTPVNPTVDEVVFRTLEKDREKRFQTARDVKSEVEHLTEGGTATQATPAPASGRVAPAAGSEPPASTSIPPGAIWGAAFTGLALLLWGGPAGLMMLGGGGLGGAELLLFGLPGGLFGLVGALLGWTTLLKIRSRRLPCPGLPLAVFAALAWPAMILLGLTLLLPWVAALQTAPDTAPVPWTTRVLPLLLPLTALALVLFSLRAAARWARGEPALRRRGPLQLLLVLAVFLSVALVLVRHLRQTVSRPAAPGPVPTTATGNPAVRAQPAPTASPVRLAISAVRLDPHNRGQRLVLDYTLDGPADGLSLRSSGRFPDGPVTLTGATHVVDAPGGGPGRETHRLELDLPASVSPAEADALRARLEARWSGQVLNVLPGDAHTLLTIPVAGREPVRVTVVGETPGREL